jgi:hypothetical protein
MTTPSGILTTAVTKFRFREVIVRFREVIVWFREVIVRFSEIIVQQMSRSTTQPISVYSPTKM